jgi:RNA polymerase sigma factor (TIGR02999 family)
MGIHALGTGTYVVATDGVSPHGRTHRIPANRLTVPRGAEESAEARIERMSHTQETVTRLLRGWARGDRSAADELFTRVYSALRRIAHRQRRRWGEERTLDTTALVHEAYLKMAARHTPALHDRAHFYAAASRAMRHVLANSARRRGTRKRGSGASLTQLDENDGTMRDAPVALSVEHADRVADLEEALAQLERVSERQCRVVECRFYGGLSIPDTATALGVSEATVKRDWAVAQAWLYRALRDRPPDE